MRIFYQPPHSSCPWSVYILRSFISLGLWVLFLFFLLFFFLASTFAYILVLHSSSNIFTLSQCQRKGEMTTNSKACNSNKCTYICSTNAKSVQYTSSFKYLPTARSRALTPHSVILAFFVCNLEVAFFSFLILSVVWWWWWCCCCCCCFGTFYKSVQCLVFCEWVYIFFISDSLILSGAWLVGLVGWLVGWDIFFMSYPYAFVACFLFSKCVVHILF